MAARDSSTPKVSYVPILIGCVTLVLLLAGYFYLNTERAGEQQSEAASAEAKAYVKRLELSGVKMQAAENFMQQQVVEVQGAIKNNGDRPLDSIDVFCLFYGVNNQLLHRERVPIVRAKGKPLAPGESRPFRLPFDNLPEGWNQAMPQLVIAHIDFAS